MLSNEQCRTCKHQDIPYEYVDFDKVLLYRYNEYCRIDNIKCLIKNPQENCKQYEPNLTTRIINWFKSGIRKAKKNV